MLGRDDSVARQQYSQQQLATKAQAILPHDSSNLLHTQAKLKFQALHVLRGTRTMRYSLCFECLMSAKPAESG